jgi:hypothetical protein
MSSEGLELMRGFDFRWIKIIGLLFDIVGTIIIAMSIISVHAHLTNIGTLLELEQELERELSYESSMTLTGLTLVFIGFLLILSEEIYATFLRPRK